jgi:hypothetical protein
VRVIITLGYSTYLLPKGKYTMEDLCEFIEVEEQGPYGDKIFVPKKQKEAQIRLIPDDSVKLPENHNDQTETVLSLEKKRSDLQDKVWALEKELKELKEICNVDQDTER